MKYDVATLNFEFEQISASTFKLSNILCQCLKNIWKIDKEIVHVFFIFLRFPPLC